MEREIEIEASGVKIPLNEFARRIILKTLLAMVGSLRGVDTAGEIRIRVGARPTASA